MPNILITGASGYMGKLLTDRLAKNLQQSSLPNGLVGGVTVVASDVRPVPSHLQQKGIAYTEADIRNPKLLQQLMQQYNIETVIHLAAVVTPKAGQSRQLQYDIDVVGTKNVVECCLLCGVRRLIITSSGAAYGYHADNPAWLTEEMPLRGNEAFAYAHHKRLVEEMLAQYRQTNPELLQIVFRVGTVLGKTTNNQITDLFRKHIVLGIRGSDSPFVFIWDEDVVSCLERAITAEQGGIYNLAGDGALSMAQIAHILHKPYLALPAAWVRGGLRLLHRFGLTQYGAEQVLFLQYRPVLSNEKLKNEFGYTPVLTSKQVFKCFSSNNWQV